jgi:hypothetical protein
LYFEMIRNSQEVAKECLVDLSARTFPARLSECQGHWQTRAVQVLRACRLDGLWRGLCKAGLEFAGAQLPAP